VDPDLRRDDETMGNAEIFENLDGVCDTLLAFLEAPP
jgi:hypothetical protein